MRLIDTVDRQAETIADLRERVGRAEADAAYADRERQRADEMAETLIALRASLTAKEREAADLARQLEALRARRRWYDPRTW